MRDAEAADEQPSWFEDGQAGERRTGGRMTAFQGETVTFIGRLEALSRSFAMRAVVAAGGVVRRGLTRRTSVCVIGHGALIRLGKLEQRLAIADANGAVLLSENQFLRRTGMMLLANPDERTFDAADIISRSGIAPEHLRMLVLFDIVEPSSGRFGLRDLLLVRSVRTLLSDGLQISEIMQELAGARKTLDHVPPNLFGDKAGRVAIRLGETVAEINGQLRLPLVASDDSSIDELFDAAEEAEDLGDWRKAERLYRRCVDRDRKDPASAYNLGNVLCRLGQAREARLWLQHAVGLDPALAEAWYNLGIVTNASGDRDEACRHFERALAADPTFADAMFNLAVLRFESGEHAAAEALWRRYLEYDAGSEWARKARCGLVLCRQLISSRGQTEQSPVLKAPFPKSTTHPVSQP
jgi:Tfp pilus assembly protein PilF